MVITRRDGRPVNPLTTFVRVLGNDRALANARRALEAHRSEDWLVEGLARRLEAVEPDPAAAPAAGATSAA